MSTAGSLRGRDLLSVADLSRPEVEGLFDRAAELKAEFRATRRHARPALAGRTLAMLFQKPSLRTLGIEVRLAHPPGYAPNPRIVERAQDLAAANGGRIVFSGDPAEVVAGASVVYSDAWTSMGQEAEAEERRDAFAGFQVNAGLLAAAGPDAIVMHCLPAHCGEEITSEVMDGPQSVVFDQSENRLHVQKALLVELIGAPDFAGQPPRGQQ